MPSPSAEVIAMLKMVVQQLSDGGIGSDGGWHSGPPQVHSPRRNFQCHGKLSFASTTSFLRNAIRFVWARCVASSRYRVVLDRYCPLVGCELPEGMSRMKGINPQNSGRCRTTTKGTSPAERTECRLLTIINIQGPSLLCIYFQQVTETSCHWRSDL